ncbi:hypothetical protein B0J12DRAFT_695972 [Macrophomina phaseolina]|uniref:C2H2-type domain-containing protein n=1 Tax=Macrophomina phaseolina TaxID=35725 RepID=A0ABQ8GLV6_9PEZI|nr:hypothetical protein B0J12DRAFT_695972 [Macrophomina phaseolina]
MSQSGYHPYPALEPGEAYFSASMDASMPSFDIRTASRQPVIKHLEQGTQALLDPSHNARHPLSSRPFDTYTYPGYEASFHPTSSSIDQVLLSGQRPYILSRNAGIAYSNPIASFYNDADGPWNSLRAASQAQTSAPTATVPVSVPNLDYNSYRDALASEISDSGYASQAAASQSLVNTEPADYNRECSDLSVQVNSFSFTAASSSSPPYDIRSLNTRNADEADATSVRRLKPGQKSLLCPDCGETAKCPSDFKKHTLKHTKPWTCDEPDCSRKEGFTTINDLKRHQKSVHKIGGMSKSFRCVADRCRNKDKLWPRLDNFKQHINRMHKDEYDMDDLINRSQIFSSLGAGSSDISSAVPASQMESRIAGIDSERSDVNATKIITPPAIPLVQQRNEESYGDLSPDLKVPFPAIFPETRPWTQSNVEEPENGIVQSQKAQENRMGSRRPQPDAPKLRELADAATAASNTRGRPSSGDGPIATSSKSESSKRGLAKEHPHKSLLAKISNMMAKSITNGAASESLQKAVLRALLELEDNRNIITTADSHSETASKANLKGRNPGKLPPRFSGPDGTELNISTAEVREGLAAMSRGIKKAVPKPKTTANTKTKKIKCPDCSSSFNRQCDLRKHSYRHSRPWGCTFSRCYKRLGSKSDWTRHEGNKHNHMAIWRCEQLRPSSASCDPRRLHPTVCAEIFWDVRNFSAHLISAHQLESPSISSEIVVRHLSRGLNHRFWCGFCQAIIPLDRRGVKGSDIRNNHIDKHFMEGKRINNWLDVETNKFKGDMERSEKDEEFGGDDSSLISSEDKFSVECGCDEGNNDGYGPLRRAAEGAGAGVLILTADKEVRGKKRCRAESSGTAEEKELAAPQRKKRKEETLFFCCGCKQGPFAWSLYQSCLHCEHEFCEHCDRRKHENSAEEESVDYNLWNHIVGMVP